jgi:hypothetical protein
MKERFSVKLGGIVRDVHPQVEEVKKNVSNEVSVCKARINTTILQFSFL